MIEGNSGVLFEANCETDFVSKNPDFIDFTKSVASSVMKGDFTDVDALNNSPMGGGTVETTRADLVGKIGENMSIRRFQKIGGGSQLASYVHGGKSLYSLYCHQSIDFVYRNFVCLVFMLIYIGRLET